jgi:hypothetical protein
VGSASFHRIGVTRHETTQDSCGEVDLCTRQDSGSVVYTVIAPVFFYCLGGLHDVIPLGEKGSVWGVYNRVL